MAVLKNISNKKWAAKGSAVVTIQATKCLAILIGLNCDYSNFISISTITVLPLATHFLLHMAFNMAIFSS